MALPALQTSPKVRIIANPSQEELRSMALRCTNAVWETSYGALNKVSSRNKNRVAQYTYIIAPESKASAYAGKLIEPEQAAELIADQRRYIDEAGELIQIDGYLGIGPRAVAVQWLYTPEGANIAGMQQVLAFSREAVEGELARKRPFNPIFRVIFTPDFKPSTMPGKQAVLVDLENYTTYIMGPDYFGESKKGALRMLNDYHYKHGGLVLHAGAKVINIDGKSLTLAVLGESGTGKTTTSFARHGEGTHPLQDDMVTIWPKGELSVTENGCFAKTHGLTAENEPAIYAGATSPDAWLENVYQDSAGNVDFSKGLLTPAELAELEKVLIDMGAPAGRVHEYANGQVTEPIADEHGNAKPGWDFAVWTQNGRTIFPLSAVPNAADPLRLPPVQSLGILNRDEGPEAAVPGIVRFTSTRQAAGYFMLGETSKTSAAGKERGKMRSPFTQPFFPRSPGLQAHRFNEIVATMTHLQLWMMNTGYVGGSDPEVAAGTALKVKIRHSTALLEALLRENIKWTRDPDFGYEVIDVGVAENKALLALVPAEICQPRLWFEKQGRLAEYGEWVKRMHAERRAFLEKHQVDAEIIDAVAPKA